MRSLPSTLPVERSLYETFAAFPAVCFTLALLTDLAFWQTSNLMWQNFSAWLLFAGLVVGALAALVRIFELVTGPDLREEGAVWLHALVCALVLALAILNSLVHAGDGWTAVVPNGLILSAATFVLMLVAGWLGRAIPFRHAFREQRA